MEISNQPYWLDVPALAGNTEIPPLQAGTVIIGSGLTGVSVGHFLQKEGFEDLLLIDDDPQIAASFRNAGHILHGTVESMKALSEIHGRKTAQEIWGFSVELCNMVENSIQELGIACDYTRNGYLVISVSEAEDRECRESVELLNSMGYESEFVDSKEVRKLGFKNCYSARFEKGSAQAHPTKFRNGILKNYINNGGAYHSGVRVADVSEIDGQVIIKTNKGEIRAEAVVLATNAYSPLVSKFFADRGLIEPFRGNIIVSKPLKNHEFKVKIPHSFDHGYEYALVLPDNRLLIGGWRNHSSTKEVGTYDLGINQFIEEGLKLFTANHYELSETIEWDYSWAGIMGSTKSGFPYIGSTTSDRIFCCAGYNGHGFSWAHGSSKMLADIMAGKPVPEVSRYFNPKHAR